MKGPDDNFGGIPTPRPVDGPGWSLGLMLGAGVAILNFAGWLTVQFLQWIL